MKTEERVLFVQGATIGLLFGALSGWFLYSMWTASVEFDQKPDSASLGNQMMRRKSRAMEDILDAMVHGDLRRVDKEAKKMEAYIDTLGKFLSSSEYVDQDREYKASVRDLRSAAGTKDLHAAKEATLRLERTCIECHALINQQPTTVSVSETAPIE